VPPARRGELAVRAALGATRGRLVRQMVIERRCSRCLRRLGLVLAPIGVSVMAQLTPRGFPPQTTSVLDLRLLASRSPSRSPPASCSD
jgi:hypothetical protein